MAKQIRALMFLLVCLAGVLGWAQTTIIIDDDFETGVLDTITWNHADMYSNAGNYGVLPEVILEGGSHRHILHFDSPGSTWRQRIGALYDLPVFGNDEVLIAQASFKRNLDTTSFFFGGGMKRGLHPGGFGEVTTIPSYVIGIPYVIYRPDLPANNGDPGNPFYLPPGYEGGFQILVPYGTGGYDVDFLYGPQTPIGSGEWHTLRMAYTASSFALTLDSDLVVALDQSLLHYSFDKPDDWFFEFGDGGSHSYELTDLSCDNALLVHTKLSILSLVDIFGLSFSDGDALYNEFGAEKLREALDYAQGDWDRFWAFLFPPKPAKKARLKKARLRLVSIERTDPVTVVVQNYGDAPCVGEAMVIAGVSYDTSWVPEWATHFFKGQFGEVAIPPGGKLALTFELPKVPDEAVMALKERLEMLWTGYEDLDPEQDYIGFIISVGKAHPVFGFLPME